MGYTTAPGGLTEIIFLDLYHNNGVDTSTLSILHGRKLRSEQGNQAMKLERGGLGFQTPPLTPSKSPMGTGYEPLAQTLLVGVKPVCAKALGRLHMELLIK